MQKKDQNKLQLFMLGIKARYEQNREYFREIQISFKSGNRTYEGLCKLENGQLVLQYNGMQKTYTIEKVVEWFAQECQKYEQSVFKYRERGHVLEILCSDKGVQMKQHEEKKEASEVRKNNPLIGKRQYKIPIDQATELLQAIGVLTKDGKIRNDKIRKYNQIDHYVELVAPMLEQEEGEIFLLDCACGKSYLSFVMNYYLREVLKKRCHIMGVDINPHVIEESQKLAEKLGYYNMEFQTADLRTFEPPKGVTAVLSLHACDIATDLALGTAIRAGAKYIVCVPCCHKELLEQLKMGELSPLTKHGVFKARFNDVYTDAMRALKLEAEGYKVSVVEYISPLDTPKNILIRAQKTAQANPQAQAEYQKIVQIFGTYSALDRRVDGLEITEICESMDEEWV